MARNGIAMCAAALAGLVLGTTADAQQVKKDALSGVIKSGIATAPAGGSTALLTTPASGDGVYILTQFCITGDPGANNAEFASIVGNTVGNIATNREAESEQGACTTYNPGIALPASEILSCVEGTASAPVRCTVTGVVSKK